MENKMKKLLNNKYFKLVLCVGKSSEKYLLIRANIAVTNKPYRV